MATWANVLFYIVFLGQILLTSYYFPQKLLGRMRHVLETYPPSSYPKLYPRPTEHYKIAYWAFKFANQCILVLGFVILLALMFWVDHSTFADDGYISEAWPAAYGMIQFLPLMVLELSEFSHMKLMRKANQSSKRKADLRRRSFVDAASLTLLGVALFFLVGSIIFDLYVHDFNVSFGHDTVQRGMVLIVTNLFLAAVGAWNLYGRKQDPHQSFEDRARRVKASVTSLLYVSIALSVYFISAAADDLYNLDFLDATLLSVYFQAIVILSIGHILRAIRPEDIDFDVYKNDAYENDVAVT